MEGFATVVGTVGRASSALRSVASLRSLEEPSWAKLAVLLGLGVSMIALFRSPLPPVARYWKDAPPRKKRPNPGPAPGNPGAQGQRSKVSSVMFVQKDCPHCADLKKELRGDIKAGRVRVVDIDSPRGKKMAEEYNVMRTPAMVPVVEWGKEKATIPPNTAEDIPIYRLMESSNEKAKPREVESPESKRRGVTKTGPKGGKKSVGEEGYKSYKGQTRTSYCNECLVGTTRLYTVNSTETISSISTHSMLTHLGSYQNPSEVFSRPYDDEIVDLKFCYTNIPLSITPEHPVLVAKDVRKPQTVWRGQGIDPGCLEWSPAGGLTERDFIAFPRITETIDIGIATPDLCELFGWYLSEGCYGESDRGIVVTFSLGHHETDRIKRVVGLIEKVFGKTPSINRGGTATTISLSSIYYAPMFKQFGNSAKQKKIPNWVLRLPEEKQYRILHGMFNGDGAISGKSITYGTVSRGLAYELRLLLFRLGILHGVYERDAKDSIIDGRTIIATGKFYTIVVGGDAARILAPKIGFDYDSGKRTSGNFGYVLDDYVMIPIVGTSRRRFCGKVYNMHIPGAESYVTLHGALHNCLVKHSSTAKELLKEAIDRSLKSGQGVEDKVRKAVDELNGMDDDLPQGEDLPDEIQERFDHMDAERRDIRKQIYAKNLDVSGGSKKELREIQGRVSGLLDYAYDTKKMLAAHENRKA